jgi:hypothetical protein
MSRTARILKRVRNIIIAALIITTILIGLGVGYTWYSGRINPSLKAQAIETTNSGSVVPLRHTDVTPNAPESASIQSLTAPVTPGENAAVTIKTNPGSWCTITVIYNKVPSKDSGLMGKTSDEYGSVTWSWTLDTSVPIGTWPVTITCLRNTKTAVVVGNLIVQQHTN